MSEVEEAELNLKEAKANENRKTQKTLRKTIKTVGAVIIVLDTLLLGWIAYGLKPIVIEKAKADIAPIENIIGLLAK